MKKMRRALLFFGDISLEVYLLHISFVYLFRGRRGEQTENKYGLNPKLDAEEEQEEHSFSMN